MEIKYFGEQCILIKGKKESLLVNPSKNILEKNYPRIVLYSEFLEIDSFGQNNKVVIMGPGEYEIGGIEINGYNSGFQTTIYTINVDGLEIGVLGKLKEPLSDKKIEKIDGMDMLVVDISNGDGVGPKIILQLAKKWGANYVIPVGYTPEGDDLKKFLDEADFEGVEPVEALKVDRENLPEGMEIAILKITK